jgi:signal transduction histidine kinase
MKIILSNQLLLIPLVSIISLASGFIISLILFSKKLRKENNKTLEADKYTFSLNKHLKTLGRILEVVKEGAILTNPEGLVIWANRKALEILKTSWIMTKNQDIGQVLPKSKEQNQPTFQVKLITLDIEEIYVDVNTFPLSETEPESGGKIFIIEDVTKSVVLEEMKLSFVAIAAHQLRTPFTAIKGYLSVLLETLTPKMTPDEKQSFDRTVISTNRMGYLIENLLTISKIEKGSLNVNVAPVNIDTVISQAVEDLLSTAKEANVEIIFNKLNSPEAVISGDDHLLIEAFSNIIANGIKYNHPGGQVAIGVEKQPEGVFIHITDNGKGIAGNILNRLFKKFYGGTGSLSELSNGLGLGLYISKSIVDTHHGEISLNSMEGKGTTVSVLLPTSQPK